MHPEADNCITGLIHVTIEYYFPDSASNTEMLNKPGHVRCYIKRLKDKNEDRQKDCIKSVEGLRPP